MKIGVYPGTFDPITNGHLDIIKRAYQLFDKLYIVVPINVGKSALFTTEERVDLIKAVLKVDCTSTCYIYNYSNEADVLEFSDTLFKILKGKGNKVRQKITPRNIEKVWTIWSNHFGEYVKNDKKIMKRNLP